MSVCPSVSVLVLRAQETYFKINVRGYPYSPVWKASLVALKKISVWLRNRLISAGLELVLSHTE